MTNKKPTVIGKEFYDSIIAFNPNEIEAWDLVFMTEMASGQLGDILDGSESEPEPYVGSDKALLKEYEDASKLFSARNKIVYRALVKSLSRYDISAVNLIKDAPRFDGRKAYLELRKHHFDPTLTNKLFASRQFLKSKMSSNDELVDDYIKKHEKAFNKVVTLKVTMEDFKTVTFLEGLSKPFGPLVISLLTLPDISFQKACADAKSFQQRQTVDEEEVETVLANSAKVERQPRRLDHNIKENPSRPTEYEETLDCFRCGQHGHSIRTCHVKERSDSPKTKREQTHMAYALIAKESESQSLSSRVGLGGNSKHEQTMMIKANPIAKSRLKDRSSKKLAKKTEEVRKA